MHEHGGADGPAEGGGPPDADGADGAGGADDAGGWGTAARATLHCLTGCAFGEILGLVIGTAFAWHNLPTMVTAIALAFVFGYSLTLYAVLRAGLGVSAAVKVALTADTVSIVVMEAVDNSVVALVPGALDAQLTDLLFWGSLALSFVIAFVVTTPVNRWMIGRGRGHAVLHPYH
ncbi:DUF4396 domain-containing protein [Streptomyces sp. HNM0575]|uniref:DUF4396 domain-containing protein n=1 Tax=Streptomyces sp. HNM0575 TaxID=2716338 RepID=UPI00145EC539|nr:DUF4396 domain-containing protein [Streptomyces sp. HNM0575]NLU74543.1 DUF4396 domain-containing protein [Streptomyces sp. HNM0575]